MDIITLAFIGAALWSFLILLAVGICRSAARADAAAAADYAELIPGPAAVGAEATAGSGSRRPVQPAPRLALR